MIKGDKFHAYRTSTGQPVTIPKRTTGRKVAEFTVIGLCSYSGQPEWYDCFIKGHPLPKSAKKQRTYQLFTKYFEFQKIGLKL